MNEYRGKMVILSSTKVSIKSPLLHYQFYRIQNPNQITTTLQQSSSPSLPQINFCRKCPMMDPAGVFVPPPLSPTISSVSSSSDLESASTGSFFHDRSTTLGTLMGVTFPPSFTFNALTPSQRRRERAPTPNNAAEYAAAEDAEDEHDDDEFRRRRLPKRRRRWWWGLCGDDICCGSGGGGVDSSRRRSSASLAEFLEVERRLGEALYGGGDQLEGLVTDTRDGERVLFEDGRVLPPSESRPIHDGSISNGVGAFRFPVSMGGLCNRGVG